MARLDPGLRRLIARRQDGMVVLTAPVAAGAVDTERVNVMIQLDDPRRPPPRELSDAGFEVGTQAGAVLTGTIPIGRLDGLERVPGVKRAELSRPARTELDRALPEARVIAAHVGPPGLMGSGVIVGIIDTGIDFRHESFRNTDSTTRILAIWDQSLTARAALDEHAPKPFTYGVEYDRERIDRALQLTAPDDRSVVAHRDTQRFHGTHVAGIAAGNGRSAPGSAATVTFLGVAPKADIVVVANTRDQKHDPGSLGDSADTLDAVDYILRKAREHGKPVVINLSQGDNIGPHDGTSLIEVGLDALITGAGCALIKSAGNGGTAFTHASGTLTPGAPIDIRIDIPSNERRLELDTWSSNGASLAVRIASPTGDSKGPFGAPFHGNVPLDNGNIGFVATELDDPVNNDNRTYVVVEPGSGQPGLERGMWTFRLEGKGAWHAWMQSSSGLQFDRSLASADTTLTIPGTAKSVISVAAYVSDPRFGSGTFGALSKLSSLGPTRDLRRTHPTLAAPGVQVHSAQPDNHFVSMKGTSQAAAMVSGAVALMFEARESSTAEEIRSCLEQSARSDRFTGATPNDQWGAGKLDVAAAVQCVRRLGP